MRAYKIAWWQERLFTERRLQVPDIPYLFVEIAMDDGTTEIVRTNQRAMSGLVQSDIDGC